MLYNQSGYVYTPASGFLPQTTERMITMKIKLENKLEESLMEKITGGAGTTITIDKAHSADEMVCYPGALTNCPICNAPAGMDLMIFMHGDGLGHYGQKCTSATCGYCWTYSAGKITVE